ncbi:hypothetical protein [Streptomyces sp. NPDC046332]|uniref:hypothetical protein n=1 Tax=Streptomyces sp. NPDC046332 TaxID=3155133 RepID=UPI0033E0B28B
MAKKDQVADAAKETDREKWMARFQVWLAMQRGVDRAVLLQAVEDVTGHCAQTGEHPRTAFGDPDACAVQAAAQLVPTDRAERATQSTAGMDALDSVLKKAREIAGL